MPKPVVQIALRIAPTLHQQVQAQASKEGLSVNAWLAKIIEERITQHDR